MRWLAIGAVASLPLFAATHAAGHTEDCGLSFDVDPFPKRVIPKVMIGWNSQSTYTETGLLGPMLIPIEIASRDPDTLHINCDSKCKKVPVFGDWTIDWEVEGYDATLPYPFQQGSIVDPHADRMEKLDDRWAVLYLPPEDLTLDTTRNVAFKATIRDLCDKGKDKDAEVRFTGTIKRTTDNFWEVTLSHGPPTILDEEEVQCLDLGSECELVGDMIDDGDPVTERYRDIPTMMYLDEVRAFTFAAKDKDRAIAECGIPNQSCSTFGQDKICDEISYEWTIEHVNPWDLGNGIIEKFGTMDPNNGLAGVTPGGQTVMFSATFPGKLRLRIKAKSKSGDFAEFLHDLEIFVRKTKAIDHRPDGQHEIYPDGITTVSYSTFAAGFPPGTEWVDWNDNGDATDVNDQNFPMAYTRDAQPLLEFFGQLAPETKTMPGAILWGRDTKFMVEYAARLNHELHRQFPNMLVLWDGQTFGNLPDYIGRHKHKVVWEVTYVPLRQPTHLPEHTYRVYTLLDDPNKITAHANPTANELQKGIYFYWESAYDISCRVAPGAKDGGTLLNGMLAYFAGGTVLRKDKDGINRPDGKPLVYWGNVATVPYGTTCGSLQEMLLPTGAANDGIGRCGSISMLFRLCLALHGEDSLISVFEAFLPMRRQHPVNPPPATHVPIPPIRAQVVFFVKNYNWVGHVGHSAEVKYYDVFNVLRGFAPRRLELDDDPDRKVPPGGADRTFYYFDADRPHAAAWATLQDLPGAPGIGGAASVNPKSWFLNHALVLVNGSYRDPSYGSLKAYTGGVDYATQNIVGVTTWDMVPDGLPVGANAWCAFKAWFGIPDAPDFTLNTTNL